MIDALAAVTVVAGGLLAALGGIGLLRFPDVFTRMHAATKAAIVGVIGTTAAAALEAGGFGGVLILGLVIALLFLTSPLGMSLLARAAYHDLQTPRSPNTRELEAALPVPDPTGVRRIGGISPFLPLWLFFVWVAVFGSPGANVIAGGAVVAGSLSLVLWRLAPRWTRAGVRPAAWLRFVGHFIAQLVAATWDVIWALRLRPDQIRPAVIEVPLRVRSRTEATLLMNSISFTPGTVALELNGDRLYVHVLSTGDPQRVIDEIVVMEDRIAAAFDPGAAGAGRQHR
jgi:multicomponent Na+:H+ antiporter subunit G